MFSQQAKRWALGSPWGRPLMSARNFVELLSTALRSPQDLGTVTNDQLAGYLVTRLCQPRSVFIDVGAHIGSIISEVTRHDRTVDIVAIEAIPQKAQQLRNMFPHVTLHNCAVGDRTGDVSFFVNKRLSGYSSLGQPVNGGTPGEIEEIRVPLRCLDNLVQGGYVDMIKIDVEGAELGVLRGAQRVLSDSRPLVMFESGPGDMNGLGFTKEDMWRFFEERNYGLHVPVRLAHDDTALSLEGFVESHLYPRRTTNYFAVPIERRAQVRDRARHLLKVKLEASATTASQPNASTAPSTS